MDTEGALVLPKDRNLKWIITSSVAFSIFNVVCVVYDT
jgi:endonuclease V-like protein UPF0215 family